MYNQLLLANIILPLNSENHEHKEYLWNVFV